MNLNSIDFTLISSLLLDCFDWMVMACVALSVVSMLRNPVVDWLLYFLVPGLVTLGFYQLVPEWMYHESIWFLVAWYVGVLLIAPLKWIPKTARLDLSRLFLTLAIGILILRTGFWSYTAFNSAFDERPGSFRLKGVVWGEQYAEAWRFASLHQLIMQRWYTPSEEERYIKPYPDNAEELLVDGLSEAENFRRSLLQPNEDGVIPAALIAKAILEFQTEAQSELVDRPGLERFDFSEEDLVEAIRGYTFTIAPEYTFEPFQGKWYGEWDGEWDGHRVDHEWRHVEYYNPSEAMGDPSVDIHHLQYAWIGDGFGWNIIASRKQDEVSRQFILGTVYHIRNDDMDQIYQVRPHVGVVGTGAEENKIIWITKGEIFLEEAFPTYYKSEESYAITGFFYERTESTLQSTGQAFQAIYTRKPNERPAFYKFDVNVDVTIESSNSN